MTEQDADDTVDSIGGGDGDGRLAGGSRDGVEPEQGMPGVRIGSGIDVHAFAEDPDRPLVLGGVVVTGAPGLAGHSDADAAVHAVTDALLGAAALGDLGSRFGVDRPATRGADSTQLLAMVAAEVAAAGWEVSNLDVTIVAQRPRLAHYREPMRARLAGVLGIDRSQVSMKFTTTDQLGSIGRGEGIAAWASCLLVSRG